MVIIKEISEMIEEELEGAEHYARKAVECKEKHTALAKTFYDISVQEMQHVALLHGEVVKLIEQHRKEKGEPPAAMMAVYEFVHNRHMCKANAVKAWQAQYRGE